jgi:primosomal protein N''
LTDTDTTDTRSNGRTITRHLDELAKDIGRLRKRTDPETSNAHLVDRLADQIETLDAITHPTAARIYQTLTDLYDPDEAATKALHAVDTRARTLRNLLGTPER